VLAQHRLNLLVFGGLLCGLLLTEDRPGEFGGVAGPLGGLPRPMQRRVIGVGDRGNQSLVRLAPGLAGRLADGTGIGGRDERWAGAALRQYGHQCPVAAAVEDRHRMLEVTVLLGEQITVFPIAKP
jgi:hypothetical protein